MKPAAMRMLVSVRDVEEALDAVASGADFIDLKEPRHGALGGLPLATIREVVGVLRRQGADRPISATIGDLPMNELALLLGQVEAVGACGVDYVKVGIERDAGAAAVIDALAGCGWPVVPVFIADRGLDDALVARACAARSRSTCAFPAIMVDTAEKQAGSLVDVLSSEAVRCFIDAVRGAGSLVGVAGALRASDLDVLAVWRPDFAGFRSAVCAGDRASRLDAGRVRELAARLHAAGRQPMRA